MPDQKISQLTAIVTVDNSADVLPIVDISANTTKKVTPTQLKTALALDNVNNTSDANKPVSTAQQDALNAKVNSNAAITPGTAAKITFDAKGLVTSGNSLDETDLPTGINANKIGTGVVSTTEFEYLNGVTSAIQTQIDSKQATLVSGTNIKTVNSTSLLGSGDVAVQETLVSGTNIKTINSTSLLGSGDITISANPSGVAGAIQFSNGSAFASDASNLFWDDTNNRLGVGTNAPTNTFEIASTSASPFKVATTASYFRAIFQNSGASGILDFNSSSFQFPTNNVEFGTSSSLGARVGIKGSGSTSATTSLLVQNSAGTAAMTVKDDLSATFGGVVTTGNAIVTNAMRITNINTQSDSYTSIYLNNSDGCAAFPRTVFVGAGSASTDASAILEAKSTTKGFLPPRMTTTQKNAIATPASGLVVYDSTTNKLQCYNGSTWNDLF